MTVKESHGWPTKEGEQSRKDNHFEEIVVSFANISCEIIVKLTNKSFQLKPKELQMVQVHVKTSPTAQELLAFEVEVSSDGVHQKLNSSVELKVGSVPLQKVCCSTTSKGNKSSILFQRTSQTQSKIRNEPM